MLKTIVTSVAMTVMHVPGLNSRIRDLGPGFVERVGRKVTMLQRGGKLFTLLLIKALCVFICVPVGTLCPLVAVRCFGNAPVRVSVARVTCTSNVLVKNLLLKLFKGCRGQVLLVATSVFVVKVDLAVSKLLPRDKFFVFMIYYTVVKLSIPFCDNIRATLFRRGVGPRCLKHMFSLAKDVVSLTVPVKLVLSKFFTSEVSMGR